MNCTGAEPTKSTNVSMTMEWLVSATMVGLVGVVGGADGCIAGCIACMRVNMLWMHRCAHVGACECGLCVQMQTKLCSLIRC